MSASAFVFLSLTLSSAPTSGSAGSGVEPASFRADYSDAALETGFFSRNGVTVITTTPRMRLALPQTFAFEVEVPVAILDDGAASGTSVIGNVSLASLFRTPASEELSFEGGFGIAFPTALVDSSGGNGFADAFAQSIGVIMMGFLPPYRFGNDVMGLFAPLRLEWINRQRAYVDVDGVLSILIPFDERANGAGVGGTMGGVVRAGYRPGPFDLSVGFGASALFGNTFFFGNDVEGQLFVEPKIGFLFATDDDSLAGLRIDTRLRINLDPPAGGSGLAGDDLGDGVYGLFIDFGYRFSAL